MTISQMGPWEYEKDLARVGSKRYQSSGIPLSFRYEKMVLITESGLMFLTSSRYFSACSLEIPLATISDITFSAPIFSSLSLAAMAGYGISFIRSRLLMRATTFGNPRDLHRSKVTAIISASAVGE